VTERKLRFDALFVSYGPDIAAYCGWRAASRSDAQDAAADVFLAAWRRLDDVPEGDAARVWLYATARRVLANQRRSNRRIGALRDRLAREPGPPHPSFGEETLVHVDWGTWRYTVVYSELGAAPAVVAPEEARPLRDGG
jgi:DNA-directed RNA polymerase specialized sigma24 family protein